MSKVSPDRQVELTIESAVVASLIILSADRLQPMLGVMSEECGSSLYDFFTEQHYQFVAMAWTEVLAGRVKPDFDQLFEYMSGMPREVAIDLINGKSPKPWGRCQPEDSIVMSLNAAADMSQASVPSRSFEQFRSVCRQLKHLRDRRDIIEGLRAIAIKVSSCSVTNGPADAVAQGIDLLGAMLGKPQTMTIGHGLAVTVAAAEQFSRDRDSGIDRVCSWGIEELDETVPMRPGGLYVLAARPKVGKTSLALQAVTATSKIHRVGVVSLEMGCEDLATIVASRALGISRKAIETKADSISDERWQALKNLASEWQETARIVVLDSGTTGGKVTSDTISAWARQQKQTRGIGLLVVDYCQLVSSNDPRAREYDTVSNTTRALKQLAGALKIPVLLLSQLNRDMEKGSGDKAPRAPKLSDLRGSGSIEQDADAVIFIHRDIMAKGQEVPAKIIVAANRRGMAGEIDALFRPVHQLFRVEFKPESTQHESMAARAASAPSTDEDFFNA